MKPSKVLYRIRGRGESYVDRETAEATAGALKIPRTDVYAVDTGHYVTEDDDAALIEDISPEGDGNQG